jgi:thiaminase (transcriptional activator TenA)
MSFFERLKTAASAEWRAYTEHPFTNGLADGSLAEAAFRHYLVQDYLFLIEFARAYALSVYNSPKLADMREAAAGLSTILDIEMNLHVKLCAGWGLSPSDLEQTPPAVEMLAYTRYVLDAGMRGDLLALKVALAPCVIGYADIATRLASRPDAHAATNPYRVWIAEYAGALFCHEPCGPVAGDNSGSVAQHETNPALDLLIPERFNGAVWSIPIAERDVMRLWHAIHAAGLKIVKNGGSNDGS